MHRHLRAAARLTGDGLNLHDAALNLRNLQLKQTLDQPRMDAGYADLRTVLCARTSQTAVGNDLQHIDLETLARRIDVRRHLLSRLQNTFRLAQLNVDILRFRINAVDNRSQDFVFLLDEVIIDLASLGFTNLLHDHLLRSLCGDAAEVIRRHLDLDDIILLIARLNLLGILDGNLGSLIRHPAFDRLARKQAHSTRFAVQLHADVCIGRRHAVFLAEIILICALERLFDRRKKHFLADVLLFRQSGNRGDHVFLLRLLVLFRSAVHPTLLLPRSAPQRLLHPRRPEQYPLP